MKKTLLTILLVLAHLCAVAQTRWQNPLEAGENTIHGRWWNSELKDRLLYVDQERVDYAREENHNKLLIEKSDSYWIHFLNLLFHE